MIPIVDRMKVLNKKSAMFLVNIGRAKEIEKYKTPPKSFNTVHVYEVWAYGKKWRIELLKHDKNNACVGMRIFFFKGEKLSGEVLI